MATPVPMEPLTWVSGSFEAHVLAARLYDEGIDAELRGALGSPYGFTVGAMARVDVYVPADQAEDARLVLLAIEVDAATDLERPRATGAGRRGRRWIVTAVVVLAASAPIVRYLFGS